ncbi:hypothetical protein O1M54_05090 [Streptomyces diastatochromogenes]|nr:hypothetical protein [Streptomyces diastatochromogenes]
MPEVPVQGAGIGAQGAAEAADGEGVGAVLLDQPERGLDDQLGGEHDALFGGAPALPVGGRDDAVGHESPPWCVPGTL